MKKRISRPVFTFLTSQDVPPNMRAFWQGEVFARNRKLTLDETGLCRKLAIAYGSELRNVLSGDFAVITYPPRTRIRRYLNVGKAYKTR